MEFLLEKIMPWAAVIFGVCVFAPMWAAVMNAAAIELPWGIANLAVTLALGFVWGLVATRRGRWL